jgi:hypothetical protein
MSAKPGATGLGDSKFAMADQRVGERPQPRRGRGIFEDIWLSRKPWTEGRCFPRVVASLPVAVRAAR